ncbi:MAG: FTR1 family iron permease [Ilumatobacteraceae bacterium]|jgi:high-affinity iron transporter
MASSLLITLREGLEISLVVAIMLAYLNKTGRADRKGPVAVGVLAAAMASIILGVAFRQLVGEFEGKWEKAIEGVLALLAVAVLTWMIFWMRSNARGIASDLHRRIDEAVDKSNFALAFIAFVAVGREGFETALFLLGADTASDSGSSVVIGGLIGLVIASVIGVVLYAGSTKVDIKAFFNWTGLLLVLFAAGLFGKGIHELRELFELNGSWYATPVWTIESGAFAEGTSYDFLKGLLGWHKSPERIRFVAYFAYLIPCLWFYFRDPSAPTAAPQKSDTDEAASERSVSV